jgi:hypothetical protein
MNAIAKTVTVKVITKVVTMKDTYKDCEGYYQNCDYERYY